MPKLQGTEYVTGSHDTLKHVFVCCKINLWLYLVVFHLLSSTLLTANCNSAADFKRRTANDLQRHNSDVDKCLHVHPSPFPSVNLI
jgi:hypothetical protein